MTGLIEAIVVAVNRQPPSEMISGKQSRDLPVLLFSPSLSHSLFFVLLVPSFPFRPPCLVLCPVLSILSSLSRLLCSILSIPSSLFRPLCSVLSVPSPCPVSSSLPSLLAKWCGALAWGVNETESGGKDHQIRRFEQVLGGSVRLTPDVSPTTLSTFQGPR
jgi:hypothetical protein